MTDAICTVEGCGRPHIARGYCKGCYKRARRDGTIERVRGSNNGKTCSVEGCAAPSHRHGWCATHSARQYRTGTVDDPAPRQRPTCVIDGCDGPHVARGYCSKHLYRVIRHGDSEYVSRAENGAGSLTSNGYLIVTRHGHPLAHETGRVLAHRAVLYDTIGDGPHPCRWCGTVLSWTDLTVDHLDWDRVNNDPANLAPSCQPCNSARTEEPLAGARHPNAKLTEADVAAIRQSPETQQAMADRYGVSRSYVSEIRSDRVWKQRRPVVGGEGKDNGTDG